MNRFERSSVIAVLLVTGLAYGLWAPHRAQWVPWAFTWLLAMVIIGALIWFLKRQNKEIPDSPATTMPIAAREEWAHEIRTPLMHITLYLHQLRQAVPAESEAAIDQLETELNRVGQLLESMSLLSQRPDHVAREPLRLDLWIQDMLPLYLEAGQTLGHPIKSHLTPVSPILCREDHLRQILSNLLSNSFRYAEVDGPVDLAVYPDGPLWVALRIANPSPPPSVDPPLLTQPFVRGHDTHDGSGLGLSVIHHLMTTAGGHMNIRYHDGIFSVDLLFPRHLPPTAQSG